jgi:DNA-directed RNA polymerase specialized sigma24 family protein
MARSLPTPPEPRDRATRTLIERVVAFAQTTPETTTRQHEDRLVGLFNLQVLAFQLWEHAQLVAQRDGVTLDEQAKLMGLARATVQVHIRKAKQRVEERPAGSGWREVPTRPLPLPPRSRSGA